MSNLDHLTAKILRDSQLQADQSIDEAKREAARLLAEQVSAANAEKDKIIAAAELEAVRTAEQIVQGKSLAIRDENLGAKRVMLDKVFAEALGRLNAMSKEEYWKFLSAYLAKLELDGEELVLPAAYATDSIDELNAYLKQQGKKGNLTLNTDASRTITGGFVLIKNGIEQNNTFEALLSYYRYELESEVLKILYA